jgi:hypothetical protein
MMRIRIRNTASKLRHRELDICWKKPTAVAMKDGQGTKKEDEIIAGEPNVEARNSRRPPVRSYTHQSTTDNPTGKTGYPPINRNQSR